MGSVQMQRICECDDAECGKEVLKSLSLSEDILVDDYQKITNIVQT